MAQAKEVRGPGPRMGGPRPKVENPGKLLKRIMDEVFRHYLPHCILVLVCIVVSALANVQASLFLKTLMDDYIVPMTQQQDPDFAPLAAALLRVGIIYVIGILAHCFGVLQHVHAQLAADDRHHADGGADDVLLQKNHPAVRQILHPAAA